MVSFSGKVARGDGVGKGLGFPTANLDCSRESVELESGVYYCVASLNEKKYKGALAILDKPWRVEVFLLDYSGDDFYGETLSVEAGEKVSEIGKFGSKKELIDKIANDVKKISNA